MTESEKDDRIIELEKENAILYNDLFFISANPHKPFNILKRKKYIELYKMKHAGTTVATKEKTE